MIGAVLLARSVPSHESDAVLEGSRARLKDRLGIAKSSRQRRRLGLAKESPQTSPPR
jgi:hypothetical protein